MDQNLKNIPLAYIHGTEVSLCSNQEKLVGGDQVFLLLTEIRKRLSKNVSQGQKNPLAIIDEYAAQFGTLEVDDDLAANVYQHCQYAEPTLKLVRNRRV